MERHFEVKILDLSIGDCLPHSFNGIEAVVSLGGPMNVYEEEKYPFLKEENLFIQKVLDAKIPFLGICLGSQLLAKASGGSVGKSPKKEIGFFPITLNAHGQNDPLFQGIAEEIEVFQWHEDMSQIPPEGVLLAGSSHCPHQAFRVGHRAYGLQFHIEVTPKTIEEWTNEYFDMNQTSSLQNREEMVKDYLKNLENYTQIAQIVYNNFLNIINNK